MVLDSLAMLGLLTHSQILLVERFVKVLRYEFLTCLNVDNWEMLNVLLLSTNRYLSKSDLLESLNTSEDLKDLRLHTF